MSNIITSYDILVDQLRDKKLVVFEGARCAGKDHLISRIAPTLELNHFELLSPRKRFADPVTGSVKLPPSVSIQQGHLWAIESLRQAPGSYAINRGMLSGQYFDRPNKDLMEMWINLLRANKGVVVLVHPPTGDHAVRIRAAKRSAESSSIFAEKTGLQRLAVDNVPEDLLLVFSEVAA